jgi:hypothetical protein
LSLADSVQPDRASNNATAAAAAGAEMIVFNVILRVQCLMGT